MDKQTDEIIERIKKEIETALESLGNASEFSEIGINEEVSRLKILIKPEDIAHMPELERIVLEGMYGSKIDDLQENSLSDARGAFLLIIFGLMERILDSIATLINKKQLSVPTATPVESIPLENLKGSRAERAISFLRYIVGLKMPQFFTQEISLIVELRNAFAHSGGVIDGKSKKRINNLRKELKREYFDRILDFRISKYDDDRFIIKLGVCFINELISLLIQALSETIEQIRQRIGIQRLLSKPK